MANRAENTDGAVESAPAAGLELRAGEHTEYELVSVPSAYQLTTRPVLDDVGDVLLRPRDVLVVGLVAVVAEVIVVRVETDRQLLVHRRNPQPTLDGRRWARHVELDDVSCPSSLGDITASGSHSGNGRGGWAP